MQGKNNSFIKFMSGTTGILVVIAAIAVCAVISGFAVYTAVQASAKPVIAEISPYSEQDGSQPEVESESESESAANTEPTSESATEPVTEPVTETEPETVTESATETEPATETETEPATEPVTEPVTEAVTEAETEPDEDKIIICIDPGHGYDDPGTDSDYLGDLSEKDITLDIALRAADILNTTIVSDIPVEIYLTRSNDVIPAGAEKNEFDQYLFGPKLREAYIKSLGNVDALVSVHCDYYEEDETLDGVRIFYSLGVNKTSVTLGLDIADCITSNVGATAGGRLPDVQYTYYDDAYYITKCTPFPAVLVECGFVTNKTEAKNMLDEDWRQQMAKSIAEGIKVFLGL